MQTLSIVIVDDEKRIRTSLCHLLTMYCPGATVLAEAENIESAAAEIKKHRPDVVLLDIDMPDGTGFDLIKNLSPINFKVIFITAFDKYAVQAFKYSALDYLLKPVNPDELVNALQKAQQQLQTEELSIKLNTFISNMSNIGREAKKIVLKTQDMVHVLNISDIVRCEADRNYTKFILSSGKNILVSGSLKEYDDMLSQDKFFRSHHSHLINLSYIDRVEKQNDQLVMKDSSLVPLATRKKEALLQLLEKN
ncbi:MAG TPA: LytTR family DNA-binding domain-containing protein [Bacteroidia bacterium]|nr:LytTR family DNA-binding domain-containing protein [Bacteroidia bacterium]